MSRELVCKVLFGHITAVPDNCFNSWQEFLFFLITKRWAFEVLVSVCFICLLMNHIISIKDSNNNRADCVKTYSGCWTSFAFISRPRKMSALICVHVAVATLLSPRHLKKQSPDRTLAPTPFSHFGKSLWLPGCCQHNSSLEFVPNSLNLFILFQC